MIKGFIFALTFSLLPSSVFGQSWYWQNPLPQGNDLHDVEMLGPTTFVAVGALRTVLRTTDAGQTWAVLQHVGGSGNSLNSISFADDIHGWAAGSDGIILHTTDGGLTWTPQESGSTVHLKEVWAVDLSNVVAVGESGTILRTTDGGMTWVSQFSGTALDLSDVSCVDANTATAVGELGTIVHTTDGGALWLTQTSGTTNDLQGCMFTSAAVGTVVGSEGTIRRTTNEGLTWNGQSGGTTVDLHDVFFTDSNHGIAVGDLGRILSTINGGILWTTRTQTSQKLKGISFADPLFGVIVGDLGTILITPDFGMGWTLLTTTVATGQLNGCFFVDGNIGAVVGGITNIWPTSVALRTTNGGFNWFSQTTSYSFGLADVHFLDANRGFLVGGDGLFSTTDGGNSWSVEILRPFEGITFTDSSNGIVVGLYGDIRRTTNGGASWFSQSSGTPWSLFEVTFANADVGIVLGKNWAPPFDTGIRRTTDGGLSWTERYRIVPPFGENIGLYGASFANDRIGLVVGYDGIILQTTDGGATWENQSGGTTSTLYDVEFIDTSTAIAIGVSGTMIRSLDQGVTWSPMASPTILDLRALFVQDTTIFLVGDNGTIVSSSRAHQVAPPAPVLVSPPNGAAVSTDVVFLWNESGGATSYRFQLARSDSFSVPLVDVENIPNSFFNVEDLDTAVTYFWRVNATNDIGPGPWSDVWSFTTMNLPAPVLLSEPGNGDVLGSFSVDCLWHPSSPAIDRYWFEWASDSTFTDSIVDSTATDTISVASPLTHGETYHWRVRAHNKNGWGSFSDVWSFSVLITGIDQEETIPTEFSLLQNYPNPFNPTTTIRYGLPQRAFVRLEVFNLLGEKVSVLVDREQEPGYHELVLEGRTLPSGIYLYRLATLGFVETKKFILLR